MAHSPIVLSLFDRTGIMVRPWAEAGFDCRIVDIRHPPGTHRGEDGITRIGADLMEWAPDFEPSIVFAFPPCSHLASSGARWWAKKGQAALDSALALHDKAVAIIGSRPGLVENPVGRPATHRGRPSFTFDPCDYGDPWTKRTCIWLYGGLRMPPKKRVHPFLGSRIHRMSSSWKDQRSATPPGFAKAIFEANVHLLRPEVANGP